MNETSRRATEERRQSLCPQCHDVRGDAKSVVVGDGKRTIAYVCPSCGHAWTNITDEKSILLKP
jgi:DNA-directed RNA polymerase subunit M/transcription elongation factor TFIIS